MILVVHSCKRPDEAKRNALLRRLLRQRLFSRGLRGSGSTGSLGCGRCTRSRRSAGSLERRRGIDHIRIGVYADLLHFQGFPALRALFCNGLVHRPAFGTFVHFNLRRSEAHDSSFLIYPLKEDARYSGRASRSARSSEELRASCSTRKRCRPNLCLRSWCSRSWFWSCRFSR